MSASLTKLALAAAAILAIYTGDLRADIISTPFNSNNGQSGNMFDINVLSQLGIEISQFELNLDAGSWDIELYTKSGTHVGSETTPSDWVLRESSTGITSVAPNLRTVWDISDFTLDAGLSAIYINVTNGTALNYTDGTGVGNLLASNSNVEIFEGTGNAVNFGEQFRPRAFNGSIEFEPIALQTTSLPPGATNAVPEPGALLAIAALWTAVSTTRRKRA